MTCVHKRREFRKGCNATGLLFVAVSDCNRVRVQKCFEVRTKGFRVLAYRLLAWLACGCYMHLQYLCIFEVVSPVIGIVVTVILSYEAFVAGSYSS